MRKVFLIIIFIFSLSRIHAQHVQIYGTDLSATLLKKYEGLEKDSLIKISEIIFEKKQNVDAYQNTTYEDMYYIRTNEKLIPITGKLKERLAFECKTPQDIWDSEVIKHVLLPLQKKGLQKELRLEREQDALDYIDRLKSNGLVYKDPYLENYIYGLIARTAPTHYIDKRPYRVNLLIVDDSSLNAGVYPNGTLIITTGLLSCLHSEDELIAILSHEIAHFVLDHQIQNVNKAISRKNRAAFWATLATGVTAVAEGVAAANGNYSTPGLATLGVATLSGAIASEVIDWLGMKYNHKQENEADAIAKNMLAILQRDTNALSSALNHIQQTINEERLDDIYFDSFTHPALIERIHKLGDPQTLPDNDFERKISFIITNAAHKKYDSGRFTQAIDLVSQNMENHVATSEDYILKAYCLFALYNSAQSNEEALSLIHSAKAVDPTNIEAYKAEIVAYLRLDDKNTALRLLQEYESILADMQQSNHSSYFIDTEISWCRNMQIKLNGMQVQQATIQPY